MSGGISSILKDELLHGIPSGLRTDLLNSYGEILRNFRERRWEPAELNGGKLCEATYTILRGYVDKSYPARASKPRNMVDACRELEKAGGSVPRSIAIQIPRMLIALYEIRNNRGVGHVGGDVNPNAMDAVCVLEMSKWLLSELVRIFHSVSTEDAAAVVEGLIERDLPLIWQVGATRRVLNARMSMKDKTLALLYHATKPVSEKELRAWVEHSNPAVYRRDVLRKIHKDKLAEYDQSAQTVLLSPLGIRHVEEQIVGKDLHVQ